MNKTNGVYKTDKGITYEVHNGQICVKHDNGYYGCLYGECSMSIFYENREIMHTGSRNINTSDELYDLLDVMPEFRKAMQGIIEDNEDDEDDV